MPAVELASVCWPASRLPEAVAELATRAGLARDPGDLTATTADTGADAKTWLDWAAKKLRCECEPLESTLRDLEREISIAKPAVLMLPEANWLMILDASTSKLRALTPGLEIKQVSMSKVCDAIRGPIEQESRRELERFLEEMMLPARSREATVKLLLDEQLGSKRFNGCWIMRQQPGTNAVRLLRDAGTLRNGTGLLVAHTLQYLLWLASWGILGTLSLQGRMDNAYLVAWALLLLTLVPCQVMTTWMQGLFAIGLGGFLKRRLLFGAMKLGPEEVRHEGIGSFLGQALEAEALETLALSGGIAGLLASIEILLAMLVLGKFAIVLAVWVAITGFAGWRFLRRFRTWTQTRLRMTYDLIESMVGHRTRLAQQPRREWHEGEDQALCRYVSDSSSLDRTGAWMVAAIPRGWVLAGLACLIPSIAAGQSAAANTALVLGGVLLAYTALRRLTASFADIAGALTAWQRIGPLFRAAARPELVGEAVAIGRVEHKMSKALEADHVSFRYRSNGNRVLQGCSLVVRHGDRILLEGPSGGGKTTFASLLSGLRQPESGLLLVNGLDRHTLGTDCWHQRVAAAPQFHENHILTETLAFNVLMARGWPPTPADMEDADAVCRELGLGPLIDTMPSGLLQMVGEGGWQLSHGERSRVYIARALLQGADVVILDESFAALDPENVKLALECTIRRAKTLIVIAHP